MKANNMGEWGQQVNIGDLQDHMAAYDALPPRLRELYDSAPIPFDPVEWYKAVLMYGQYTAEELILALLKKEFPNWDGRPVNKRGKKL